MLHIPGILDCTYHLHVSCLCAQGSSIAEYLDYSRSCKKRHLRACVPVRFARVHTPKLHLTGGGPGGVEGLGLGLSCFRVPGCGELRAAGIQKYLIRASQGFYHGSIFKFPIKNGTLIIRGPYKGLHIWERGLPTLKMCYEV